MIPELLLFFYGGKVTISSGQNDESELSGRKNVTSPVFEVLAQVRCFFMFIVLEG